MTKNNFLLVDLSEKKTKRLAETITSDTSRKILNYLAEKEHDTESNISKELSIAISTVHYHLQKLQEAELLIVEEFHYSKKGREINHYKLANKYIIIAPKKVSGLKEKLKGLLPVSIITILIGGIIKLGQEFSDKGYEVAESLQAEPKMMAADMVKESAAQVTPQMMEIVTQPISIDMALWFLIGGATVIILYIIIESIRNKIRK